LIVSRKIAGLFKNPGFVNIDYLIENKLERNSSKILNIINRDWRKWVKPVCMKPNPKTLDPLDPNFGNKTLGTYAVASIENRIIGSVFTLTESGTADSITVGLLRYAIVWTGRIKCAIYRHSDLSLVGVTEERTITTTTTATWYTFNFIAPKPSLTADDYILVVWGEDVAGETDLCFIAGVQVTEHYQNIAYNGFPNPLVPTHSASNDLACIYCTYTKLAKPKGTIAIHTKLAGII